MQFSTVAHNLHSNKFPQMAFLHLHPLQFTLSPYLKSFLTMCNPVISSLKFLSLTLLIFFFLEISFPKATAQSQDPFSKIFLNSEFDNEDESLDVTLRTCTLINPSLNYRPVIGILTHPGDCASGRLSNATGASCIAASYVRFVQSAGARVIPLIYNEPSEVLEEKLSLVNGVIFTGGRVRTGLYYSVAESIFKKILERNDAGDYVPLYGISLGFQIISTIVSKDSNILESFNATRIASTLKFNDYANIAGTVIQRLPLYLRKRVTRDCIAWQDHRFGISPYKFEENEGLSSFFQILSTSTDKNNKVYVSTANAWNYPVTIFQWSPEKNAYEWGISAIPHTGYAVELTQLVAVHLVSEARKSTNSPPAKKILDYQIYNYKPTYSGKAGKGYDEVYIFE